MHGGSANTPRSRQNERRREHGSQRAQRFAEPALDLAKRRRRLHDVTPPADVDRARHHADGLPVQRRCRKLDFRAAGRHARRTHGSDPSIALVHGSAAVIDDAEQVAVGMELLFDLILPKARLVIEDEAANALDPLAEIAVDRAIKPLSNGDESGAREQRTG